MISINNTHVDNIVRAIYSARNAKNSWDKSDSDLEKNILGDKDLKLGMQLANAGDDHGKFMRMINVTCDITAPLYWFKEYSTYKVGTVADSCSTMHKIHAKKFTIDDFSHDHLLDETETLWSNYDGTTYDCSALDFCQITCDVLNHYRDLFLETQDKKYWWQMIQLLPSSYNQKRTVQLNYQVLKHMYHARKNHKLDEWHQFCDWIETLPHSELITGVEK